MATTVAAALRPADVLPTGVPAPIPVSHLMSMLDSVAEAVLATDDRGRVTHWNRRCEQVFGLGRAQVTGRRVLELIDGQFRDRLRSAGCAVMAGQTVHLDDVPIAPRSPKASPGRRLNIVLSPLAASTGIVAGIQVVCREVLDAQTTIESMVAGLDSPESQFHALGIGQVLADDHLRIVAANETYAELAGRSVDKVIGLRFPDVTHADDVQDGVEQLNRLTRGELNHTQFERRVLRPDGTAVPVLTVASAVRDADGRLTGIAVFLVDLRKRAAAEERLRQQEARFRSLVQNAADIALIADDNGELSYVSPAISAQLGYGSEELLRTSAWEMVHPDDHETVRPVYDGVVRDGGRAETYPYRVREAKGRWRWVKSTITDLRSNPAVDGIVMNVRDVTERVEAKWALEASEQRYRSIVSTAQEGIVVIDANLRLLYANDQLATLTGHSLEDLRSPEGPRLFAGDRIEELRQQVQRSLDGGVQTLESDYAHPDGRRRWLRVVIKATHDDDGHYAGTLLMITDMTERKEAENLLETLALYDPSTQLPNRTLLTDRLQQSLDRRTEAAGFEVAALFCDVDRFKSVNERLGHAAGDDVIREVARRLAALAGRGVTVGRFGGDEFVVTCEVGSVEEVLAAAERVRAVFADPVLVDGATIQLGVSIGAVFAGPYHNAGDVLRDADTAMACAKARGRGRVELFDDILRAAAQRDLVTSGSLSSALMNDELTLHYQPIMDLATAMPVGYEALARWQHPLLGDVPPAEFVAVAERTGLIDQLGAWALDRACRDLACLRSLGPDTQNLYMAVNVSVDQLRPGFPQVVVDTLREHGLPASALVLEVTETAVLRDDDGSVDRLEELRALGVCLAIDDFGTGYASLAYLKRIAIDQLKVDRAFIAGLGENPEDLAITSSVLGLASSIGVPAVAEGVETLGQLATLRRLGCARAQGYLWSRPVPFAQIAGVTAALIRDSAGR